MSPALKNFIFGISISLNVFLGIGAMVCYLKLRSYSRELDEAIAAKHRIEEAVKSGEAFRKGKEIGKALLERYHDRNLKDGGP